MTKGECLIKPVVAMLFCFMASSGWAASGKDKIELLNNTNNDDVVVFLDGRFGPLSDDCKDDEKLPPGRHSIEFDNILKTRSCNSEVVIFSKDHAMELITTNKWTNKAGDVLRVRLRKILQVPVTIYLMRPDYEDPITKQVVNVRQLAEADMARANFLYNTMGCGIEFKTVAIKDMTSRTKASPDAMTAMCSEADLLMDKIAFNPKTLNVYYLETLGAVGWCCTPTSMSKNVDNMLAVGQGASLETLAHEFGHALSLEHTDTSKLPFSNTNLMWGGSRIRNSITKGQCFRANVNVNSIVNINMLRSGPTRSCLDGYIGNRCPALDKND